MPALTDLGAGLGASRQADRLEFAFPGGASGLRFEQVPGRVTASLTFAGSKLRADVSFQPGAVQRLVDSTAREQAVDPNRWRMAVLTQLRDWSGLLPWCPLEPSALLMAIGALTHPLLGSVYQHGRHGLGEVPRWALDVLRAPDPTAAARALAGDRANRRLARALANSLLGGGDGGHVELAPLALAVIGRDLLSVDELANVLEAPTTTPPERLPTVDDIRAAQQALALYPAGRRPALVLDVARHHDARAMADAMTQLWWVRDRADQPLPVRLDEVRQMCTRLVPVLAPAAEPTPPWAPTAVALQPEARPARARPRPRPQPLVDEPVAPPPRPEPRPERRPAPAEPVAHLAAPPAAGPPRRAIEQPRIAPHRAPAPGLVRWPIPQELLRIHGYRRDGLEYVVPTSVAELRAWGITLHNCVGDYGPSIANGASWVIGVLRDDRLIGCVEVVPRGRHVRQVLGPRNLPLAPHVSSSVLLVLEDRLQATAGTP